MTVKCAEGDCRGRNLLIHGANSSRNLPTKWCWEGQAEASLYSKWSRRKKEGARHCILCLPSPPFLRTLEKIHELPFPAFQVEIKTAVFPSCILSGGKAAVHDNSFRQCEGKEKRSNAPRLHHDETLQVPFFFSNRYRTHAQFLPFFLNAKAISYIPFQHIRRGNICYL